MTQSHEPGLIVLPQADGSVVKQDLPALRFTSDEARTLRDMKKILEKYGWQCIYRCRECLQAGKPVAWVDGGVMDDQIVFICKHQQVVFRGQTL